MTLRTIAPVAILAGAASVAAHHAFSAEFDAGKPVQPRGTVVRVEGVKPHTWIHIDDWEADGKVARWMIEEGTPSTLLRRGLTRESPPQGTEIVVDGYRAENGTLRANGRDLTFSDGRKLFMGSSGIGAPDER